MPGTQHPARRRANTPPTDVGEPRSGGGRLVMVGEFKDPTSGMMMKMKSVTWMTDDGYMAEMYNILPDGSEFKSMEFTGKRRE